MSKEQASIHDFDLEIIVEYFSMLKRQGPGSTEQTHKALSFVENLDNNSKIVDLGCGTGAPTMDLAKHVPGKITGIDLFSKFIHLFNRNAESLNLQHKVKGETGTMEELPFEKEELDLIWSEGAIYNIGFKRGMNDWREFLKPGAYIAVTEACWFTNEQPKEIRDFWLDAYPEIDTIPNKLQQMQDAGFMPVASFILPEDCWYEHFYAPQEEAQREFLQLHAGNKTVEEFIGRERYEFEMYKKYSRYYGYVFFIGKKI
ncbi:MAG: class I SAM-dependent methyltransferase [Bacteroidales bacterium]|nr:class I SAM-dependent methyltransferase [Bacteroidales bacterium]